MYWQTVFVICCVVLSNCEEYQDSLRKLWHKDSDSVTNSETVIQPSRFTNQYAREARVPYMYRRYAFKPRAIPIAEPKGEITHYYKDDIIKNKTDILFPGNYVPIAKENGVSDNNQFHGTSIPLLRSADIQRRSFDVDEPIIEKPEGFSEVSGTQRSISYLSSLLGGEDEGEQDDYGLDDYSESDDTRNAEERKKGGLPIKKLKPKKLKKYMLPLLLAYKMKFFSLIPVAIAGLVLLIGATGLAGFFFALFAAVMGLQKGGY